MGVKPHRVRSTRSLAGGQGSARDATRSAIASAGPNPSPYRIERRTRRPARSPAGGGPSAATFARGRAFPLGGGPSALRPLPPERIAHPIRRTAIRLVSTLDLLFDVEARLDVGEQLVGGELGETGDRVAEAIAETVLRGFQQELAERLLRDPLRLGVQDPRHLELKEAGIRALAVARTAITLRTAVRAASGAVPGVSIVIASALVHDASRRSRSRRRDASENVIVSGESCRVAARPPPTAGGSGRRVRSCNAIRNECHRFFLDN